MMVAPPRFSAESRVNALRDSRRAPPNVLHGRRIAIGILALTVVGSLAERLHTIVTRSTSLNTGIVFATIQRSTMLSPNARQTITRAYARLRTLDGVRAAAPR